MRTPLIIMLCVFDIGQQQQQTNTHISRRWMEWLDPFMYNKHRYKCPYSYGFCGVQNYSEPRTPRTPRTRYNGMHSVPTTTTIDNKKDRRKKEDKKKIRME